MARTLPPAYVLWLGPTGLTVVRALGRAGIPVVACHDDRNEPCTGTKYARVKILPTFATEPDAWLRFLLDEGRRFAPAKAVLMVASDAHWLFVARHRTELKPHYLFALPDAADILEWVTKPWQEQAAVRAGIPVPRSATPRSAFDLHTIARDVVFPCILKPALSHEWRRHYPHKLAFVRDASELIAVGEDALARNLAFTVQEYIPAADSDIYGLYCALDRDSRPLAMCVSRKIRQFEPRFGSGCVCECTRQPEVEAMGLRFLQSIGYHGIASVEFKRDPRDGQFKFMEANLRPPLMMGHAIDSGVNLPLASYCDLIDEPMAMQTPRRLGKRVGLIAQDLHSAQFYRSLGMLTWRSWARAWLRTRDLHFAWDDLRPFHGYAHMLWDHSRQGRYKRLPETFPTMEQWKAGEWNGSKVNRSKQSRREVEVVAAA